MWYAFELREWMWNNKMLNYVKTGNEVVDKCSKLLSAFVFITNILTELFMSWTAEETFWIFSPVELYMFLKYADKEWI